MNIILKPFSLLLTLLYNLTASYGWAIILFAIVLKVVLFPFALKGKRSMVKTTMLQGQVSKIQKQYANNKQKQSEELQKLYDKEGANPMSGCLWSLIPLFILIPLYAILRHPMQYMMDVTADQVRAIAAAFDWDTLAVSMGWTTQEAVSKAMEAAEKAGKVYIDNFASGPYNELFLTSVLGQGGNLAAATSAIQGAGKLFAMNFGFLGMNLAQVPQLKIWTQTLNWNNVGLFLMPILSAALSLLMSFVTNKTNAMNNPDYKPNNGAMTLLLGPVMSLWIGYVMPAGLCVYWIINSLLTIAQEFISAHLLKKDYAAAAEARRKQALLDEEEEKRRKAALAEERAKRAAEKKQKGGKKKSQAKEKEGPSDREAISASRVGLRAYARGRAYDPARFGSVTLYRDPNADIDEDAIEQARAAKAEKAAQAAEDADIAAAVQARVDAEMETLDGTTAQEVAEKIREAHAGDEESIQAEADALADTLQRAEEETDRAWEAVTGDAGDQDTTKE